MSFFFGLFAFALGAIVGSFLNVVIHRYPLGESIVFPPSRCPACRVAIRPWDNVPLLSYLFLRGRCRDCKAPISLRYPLIELSNALFYLATYLRTGPHIDFFPVAIIVSMTLVLIYIDLDIQILPDVIDLPGIGVGLLIGALHIGVRHTNFILSSSITDSVLGALFGAGLLYSIALVYRLVRKVEGMGLGDVKMLAMIGAVVGWRAMIPVLFLASCTGAVFGIILAFRQKQGLQFALPFGVFLGLATLGVAFFGHTLLEWYRSILLR